MTSANQCPGVAEEERNRSAVGGRHGREMGWIEGFPASSRAGAGDFHADAVPRNGEG